MLKQTSARARGFTLIELLVVVAIIGLLSTLAVVALSNARQRARDSKRVSDIKQVQTALELYFSDQNSYPFDDVAGAGGLTLGGASSDTLDSADGFGADSTATVYMGQVPSNPTPNGAAYVYRSLTSAGGDCDTEPCGSYNITFTLEAATGGLTSGAHTASPTGIQ